MGKGARNRDLRRRARELFDRDPTLARSLLHEPAQRRYGVSTFAGRNARSLARKLRRTRA